MTDTDAERRRVRALIERAGVATLMNVDAQGFYRVDLTAPGHVAARLSLFDVTGRRLQTVWEGQLDGHRTLQWSDRKLNAGLYLMRLDLPTGPLSRRVFLIP